MRQAYDYLDRAERLTDDPEIKAKLDLMASTIADYYVEVANKYLSKPLSSGVGLGMGFSERGGPLSTKFERRPGRDDNQ